MNAYDQVLILVSTGKLPREALTQTARLEAAARADANHFLRGARQ